jgi:hypothetical protein
VIHLVTSNNKKGKENMAKSFAQAMFENDAQQYGMSKHEARRAVARYMQEQEDAKEKRQQQEGERG